MPALTPDRWAALSAQVRDQVLRDIREATAIPREWFVGVDWGAGESRSAYVVYDEVAPMRRAWFSPFHRPIDLVCIAGVWQRAD